MSETARGTCRNTECGIERKLRKDGKMPEHRIGGGTQPVHITPKCIGGGILPEEAMEPARDKNGVEITLGRLIRLSTGSLGIVKGIRWDFPCETARGPAWLDVDVVRPLREGGFETTAEYVGATSRRALSVEVLSPEETARVVHGILSKPVTIDEPADEPEFVTYAGEMYVAIIGVPGRVVERGLRDGTALLVSYADTDQGEYVLDASTVKPWTPPAPADTRKLDRVAERYAERGRAAGYEVTTERVSSGQVTISMRERVTVTTERTPEEIFADYQRVSAERAAGDEPILLLRMRAAMLSDELNSAVCSSEFPAWARIAVQVMAFRDSETVLRWLELCPELMGRCIHCDRLIGRTGAVWRTTSGNERCDTKYGQNSVILHEPGREV